MMPGIFSEGRLGSIVWIAVLAIGQALAAAMVAFSTRDIFSAFHAEVGTVPVYSLLWFALSGLVITALRVLERSLCERVGQQYAASLRMVFFSHLADLSPGDIAHKRLGPLAIRFISDLNSVRSWVSMGIGRSISMMMILPGAIIVLTLLNKDFAMVVALPLAAAMLGMLAMAPRLHRLHRDLRKKRGRISCDMTERIPLAQPLKLLGREQKEVDQLKYNSALLREAAIARARHYALLRAVPDVGISISGGGVLFMALSTNASAGEAAAALAMVGIIALPLRDVAGIYNRYAAWRIAREKCALILTIPRRARADTESVRPLGTGPARLEFEGVYKQNLVKINTIAQAGEIIAVCGHNGAGKSALMALASGLEQASMGRVRLDGRDVDRLDPQLLNASVGWVSLNTPILKGSLRKALTLDVSPRPGDEVLAAVVRKYGLQRVADRLGGLDGKVAEGARNLSRGERLRILLARASVKRPRLLLIDGSVSCLDIAGLDLVIRLIGDIQATTLIVSDQTVVLDKCDKIWHLSEGQLMEYCSKDIVSTAIPQSAEGAIAEGSDIVIAQRPDGAMAEGENAKITIPESADNVVYLN